MFLLNRMVILPLGWREFVRSRAFEIMRELRTTGSRILDCSLVVVVGTIGGVTRISEC